MASDKRMAGTTEVSRGAAMYTFQQPPNAMGDTTGGGGANYRDPFPGKPGPPGGNIMHDRRIVRGNTYAAQVLPLSAQAELQRAEKESQRQQQRKRVPAGGGAAGGAMATKGTIPHDPQQLRRPETPDAVEGRKHMDIQTEQYLEELKDKPDEVTQESQTDPMLDRPPTPLYVPFKTGRDAETQILEGELFNFDDEVDPILDVMVGKTVEQAMLEVMQEEEVELLRRQQMEFEQRRKEEVLESQRLEAAEKRKFEEKERRKKQEMARIKREKESREKLCARMFAKSFLANLENKVFARLEDEGWFYDSVERETELDFMPWLLDEVDKELEKNRRARRMVDELIRSSIATS